MKQIAYMAARLIATLAIACVVVTAVEAEEKTIEKESLKIGSEAPNFKLKGSDGKSYELKDFKGKSAVVVAWYPKALTGG